MSSAESRGVPLPLPLLLVLRADSLSAQWRGGAGVQLALAPGDALDAAVAALRVLRERLADAQNGLPRAARITVLLAGPAVGLVSLPWSDALLDAAESSAHVAAELRSRGLDAAVGDRQALDAQPALGRPRTVFWVPDALARELALLAAALGAAPPLLQPLVAVAVDWARRQMRPQVRPGAAAMLGVLCAGTLHLVPLAQRDARPLLQLADAPGVAPLPERLAALWQRAALRLPALAAQRAVLDLLSLDEPPPADAPPGIDWLPWPQGPAPGQARSALDQALGAHALERPQLALSDALPSPWRRAAALLAAACLAGAALLLVAGLQRQAETQWALQPAPPLAAAAVQAPNPAERADLRAAQAAVRQLNLQWPALWRALDPPRDLPVMLLSLELASRAAPEAGAERLTAGSPIKLTLEAPSSQDMTRYLSFLATREGIAAAQLVRHEIDPAQTAAGPYRFDVEIAWLR